MVIIISTINYSYRSYVHQLSYLGGPTLYTEFTSYQRVWQGWGLPAAHGQVEIDSMHQEQQAGGFCRKRLGNFQPSNRIPSGYLT